LFGPLRAVEWWDSKLVPILCAFYATALVSGAPLRGMLAARGTLLASLIPGAVFVSVINDVTDLADDAAAGKRNRVAGLSVQVIALLLAIPIAIGAAIAILWRHDAALVSCYLAAWIAFSLYSLPPFRLKTRGILGVVADASGANLFPTLLAVLLAFRTAGATVQPVWVAAIAAWSFGYGMRGILWHQLGDHESDRLANVRTFVARHAPETAARAGRLVAFPIELAGLAAMLCLVHDNWPARALLAYVLFSILRAVRGRTKAIIVVPQENFVIVLHEYYDAFLPLSLLIASSLAHRDDWLVLVLHLLLFPRRVLHVLHHATALGTWCWQAVRFRVIASS
jgi:hypothetical protein